MGAPDTTPNGIDALRAELTAERAARQEAEARAAGAEAMVAHLKLLVAKLRHDRYGASSERGRKLLDQLEFELEELEANAAEDASATDADADKVSAIVSSFTRRKPMRGPLPAHLRASVSSFRARQNAPVAVECSPSWARRSPRPWRAFRVSGR